ncbi:MAG: extracellular solute-binding protein [Treponema sp.]|jgi:multiple sugar transport system substrate-binding protein|nr:extracellular solute-binding protein [Treponema sp.]
MKKLIVAGLALVLVTAAVFASGNSQKGGGSGSTGNYIRLTWWGNMVRDEQTAKVAELFKSKNPGVTIDLETTGWGGYWDKVNTQAASGSTADLMQQDYLYIGQWASRGQLLDLTPYIQDGTIDVSSIPASVVDSGKIDGKLYGIPLGTTIYCLAVDPAVLEKAGIPKIDSTTWTWKDFERIAETVYQKTGVQTVPFGASDVFPDAENYVRQSGVSFYAPDGKKLGFSDSALLKEFWDMELRLLDKGILIPPSESFIEMSQEESPLPRGRSWVMALWNTQVVANTNAAGRPLELLFTPKIERYKRPGAFLKPSMFFSITAKAENPSLAAKFLNFFLNDPEANDIISGERGVPVVASVRDALNAKLSPPQKAAGINSTVSWIGEPSTAIWTLIILAVWQFGSSMLIFLAGLRQIPAAYYEAAQIDGAGVFHQFLSVTLPQMTPVVFFNLVMQLIGGFTVFTQAFVVSGGNGDPYHSACSSRIHSSILLFQPSARYWHRRRLPAKT